MYQDLKVSYWWYGMKCEVAEYVVLCDTCQRVKVEHQHPAGLLQPLKVPQWKWEEIRMDFIMGLPKTQRGYDSIWVIMDRLTEVAHFIPIKTTYIRPQLVERYISRIIVFMVYLRRSCPTEELSSLQSFGKDCMSRWIQS
jgi:hypothetical protein